MRSHPQIDELLERHGLSCIGDEAIDVIAIDHPGLSLYPLDKEQGERFQTLQTAAALVDNALLMDSPSEDLA